ncbi:MAG: 16S rRNA (guanine(527)-N(7))-methyltransferase RsmG [Lachnospiraceae bacterium]|nr:16S rRNA (guanine(527)-N(7))-methyltransferase RsmG [Lachnospiraceae bacterium]
MDNFRAQCEQWKLQLTPRMEEQFERYYELLKEWNSFMNLTAITEREEVYKKHFLDSLSFVCAKEQMEKILSADISKDELRLIDVGTGAGFPAVPLKIVFPHLQVTLLDALQKRIDFLNEVIRSLGLEGIETVHGRAEDFASNEVYRETYDLCVSRAVAGLNVLSEYDLPFVKVGGLFVSYKSEKSEEELKTAEKALHILGGEVSDRVSFSLYGAQRDLILIKKVENTPKKYPRKAGTPNKKPL